MRLRHHPGRRRLPVRAGRRQPREQRPERQHQRLLGLPAQPAARAGRHLRPPVLRRCAGGEPDRPLRHDLAGPRLSRTAPGATLPAPRATSGPRAAIDGARTASIPWVVVGMHKPCITVGEYACDPGADLFNLLLSKKVDLVLSGHEHTYQRSHQLGLGAGCASAGARRLRRRLRRDSDNAFAQGAGSVAAVVGTGGVESLQRQQRRPEARLLRPASGAERQPDLGCAGRRGHRRLPAGLFVRGRRRDLHRLVHHHPRRHPEHPAGASFTSTCTDLTCTFDGSGSTDSGRDVAGYAWNFGDGTTGTGVTPPTPTPPPAPTPSA